MRVDIRRRSPSWNHDRSSIAPFVPGIQESSGRGRRRIQFATADLHVRSSKGSDHRVRKVAEMIGKLLEIRLRDFKQIPGWILGKGPCRRRCGSLGGDRIEIEVDADAPGESHFNRRHQQTTFAGIVGTLHEAGPNGIGHDPRGARTTNQISQR